MNKRCFFNLLHKSHKFIFFLFSSLAFAETTITPSTVVWDEDVDDVYILSSDVTVSSRINVTGEVTLHLNEGCTLTASCGIGVQKGNTLTIEGSGTLIATGASGHAGIGGNGGRGGGGGDIIINGGTITARGGWRAAGIGGGGEYNNGDSCDNVTVNGGTVEAYGGDCAAGIGGGNLGGFSGVFTMNGGKVKAVSGSGSCAGIGGGDGTDWSGAYGGMNTAVINGGELYAESRGDGSAIGGSGGVNDRVAGGGCSRIEFNGGKVYLKSASGSAAGPGSNALIGDIVLSWNDPEDYLDISSSSKGLKYATLTINKDFRFAGTGDDGATVTKVTESNIGKNKIVPLKYFEPVKFLNGNYYISETLQEKTFYGAKITRGTDPVLEGCEFKGWYKNRSLTLPWNFDTDLIKEELILYAKFVPDNPLLSMEDFYYYNDGNEVVISPKVTSSGGLITLRAGIDFDVSYKNASGVTVSSVELPGQYTLTVTGKGDCSRINLSRGFAVIKNPSGSGTQNDPYRVFSSDDWNLIKDNLSYGYSYSEKYFLLESDIAVDSCIGEALKPFDGFFNGNGHIIYKTVSPQTGLFCIRNASVTDFYANMDVPVYREEGENIISGVKSIYTQAQPGLNEKITVGTYDAYIGGSSYTEVNNLEDFYTLGSVFVKPDPVLILNGKVLKKDTDYTVTFKNSSGTEISSLDAIGKYIVSFTGTGNYTGELECDFNVSIDKTGSLCEIETASDGSSTYFLRIPSDKSQVSLDVSDCEKGFSFKIYDDGGKGGGYFSGTPGNFSSNAAGSVKITVREGFLIQVSGSVATVSESEYLSVYDGGSSLSPALYSKVHGENSLNSYKVELLPVNSSTNEVFIYFKGTGRTCEGVDLTVTVVETKSIEAKSDEYNPGVYYTTFYAEGENYLADENTSVFYAVKNSDGKIILKKVSNKVIKSGEGVILKSSRSNITLYSTSLTADYDSLLKGTYRAADSVGGTVYVLASGKKGGVGFYRWTGSLEANKAYLRAEDME